ncbi:DUF5911 domain-containing protein [Paraburkholderia sediminicola]
MKTTALVSLRGSIDFMCFPRIDSPAIFAGLLEPSRGGASGNFATACGPCSIRD